LGVTWFSLTLQCCHRTIHLSKQRNKKDMDDLILSFKALADETRLRIIHLLLTHDLCVGALADHLSMSKAAVSQHLQILRKAGLVKGEKRGYWTHYGVDKQAIYQVAEALRETADKAPDCRIACHRSVPDESQIEVLERMEFPMCRNCRQQPTQLENAPQHRTSDQIKKCHGDGVKGLSVSKRKKK